MKLVTFVHDETSRLGALCGDQGEQVLDLAAVASRCMPHRAGCFDSMLSLIRAGDEGLALARQLLEAGGPPERLRLDGLALLAPLPLPEQIRDFANYEGHVRQAIASSMQLRANAQPDPRAALEAFRAAGAFDIPPVWYERPLYYKGNRFSVVGHDADVVRPHFARRMDYELEIAVVIGKKARNLSPQQAMDAVFGYTIYNDFSARDIQSQETAFRMGPAKGKDFDTGNALGPCILTRDEVPDPDSLQMRAWVNGELRSVGKVGGMQHGIAQTISFLSQAETLYPGEILGMGTVTNGCGYESLRFLQDGDVVELEIERIGRLRNRLVATTA